jgi:integrase
MARGSLRLKRQPDYWELRAYAGPDPITARPRYVSRTFRGGKRDANKALAQLVAEVDSIGTHADQSVAGLLLAHIDHLEQRGREARTIESYRGIARKVAADRLGGKMIQDLGPKDIDDFYVRLRSNGLSPGSIKRYHSVLGGAFQQAMKWGWTNRNVVRLATPPAVPRQSRTTPTPTVVTALLREAAESRNPENHVAFRLLAATGARRGEICGLRWSSVDLDRRVLWIRHSVARLKTGKLIEKDPKSHQTREVAIDKGTAQILSNHRERQEALAAMLRTKLDSDGYVIADLAADPTGLTPISPDRLTQAFKRLTARVPGASDVRLHDLRHWYASTQLDAGESLPAVAARIGDHVETLARVYAHRGHRGDHDAADNLGALIDSPD